MTANLRRKVDLRKKVLKRAHEEAQKSAQKLAEKSAQKSAQKLDQKSAQKSVQKSIYLFQRKLDELLARAEKAKQEIAYYNANLQNKQHEKEQKEEIVVDLIEARKNLAIKNWYKRHRALENRESKKTVAEEPKKKRTKKSDEPECKELLTLGDKVDSNGIILIF